jgi:hypothetical protein
MLSTFIIFAMCPFWLGNTSFPADASVSGKSVIYCNIIKYTL